MSSLAEINAKRRIVRTRNLDDHDLASSKDHQQDKLSTILVFCFILSLIIPIIFYIGTIRLSFYRVFLIFTFIPCLISWASGRLGKVCPSDLFLFSYCSFSITSLVVNHGVQVALEPSGIVILETLGPYLLARRLIRNADEFLALSRIFLFTTIILLPFAMFETITGQNILLTIFDIAFETFKDVPKDTRWGLDRVQGPFEHPILFGVFCSAGFGLSFYVVGKEMELFKRSICALPSSLGVFLSLSSGPLSALIAQIFLVTWDVILKSFKWRWVLLAGLTVVAYVTVDVISNRTPIKVFISHFAFDTHTAYNRILIWDYGSAEVLRHPFFGIGLNEWERAWWMSTSLDMFWLVQAVQYGLPAALCFTLAFAHVVVSLSLLKDRERKILDYRTGFIITFVGLSLAGWTVHYWNATYCLFMFLLGSGVWMLAQPHQTGNLTNAHSVQGKRSKIDLVETPTPQNLRHDH